MEVRQYTSNHELSVVNMMTRSCNSALGPKSVVMIFSTMVLVYVSSVSHYPQFSATLH